MNPSEVTAVVVTRGDVSLTEILESLRDAGFDEVLVWINGDGLVRYLPAADTTERVCEVNDYAVYGRYAAIQHARNDLIYVQDDDCLIPIPELFEEIKMRAFVHKRIFANMPGSRWGDYPDSCLVGWGAVFHRDLPEVAWKRWSASGAPASLIPHDFNRECDVVFTTLVPHVKIDVGFQHLPWAEDPARAMFLGPRPERERAYELARAAR